MSGRLVRARFDDGRRRTVEVYGRPDHRGYIRARTGIRGHMVYGYCKGWWLWRRFALRKEALL